MIFLNLSKGLSLFLYLFIFILSICRVYMNQEKDTGLR